jgi:type II restriction enzyme
VELQFPIIGLENYASLSQRARVGSEAWGEKNFFCVNCTSERLERTRTNTPAIDFTCPKCEERFQLKSQKRKIAGTLSDGAYEKMKQAIEADKTPNLFALHYDIDRWAVKSLILIPRFSYTLSVIKRRNPLRSTAKRHGWVGCSILLGDIPAEVKIPLITDGTVHRKTEIRETFKKLRKFGEIEVEKRSWILDVLSVVQSLGKKEFSLQDVYAHTHALAKLHPNNHNVQPKIRQQLQELRDLGFLTFDSPGNYTLF